MPFLFAACSPTASAGSPTATAAVTDEISNSLGYFTLTKNNNAGTGFKVDEFRLGDALADVVVPEPASISLLAGAVLLLARRRK